MTTEYRVMMLPRSRMLSGPFVWWGPHTDSAQAAKIYDAAIVDYPHDTVTLEQREVSEWTKIT